MSKKYLFGLHRFFLVFALLIPFTFATPANAATTQCSTTITTQTPTNTFVRTFSFIIFGTVTGDWSRRLRLFFVVQPTP